MLELKAKIGTGIVPDLRRVGGEGISERHRRQWLVIHYNEFAARFRHIKSFRDDQSHAVAHMTHLVGRQDRMQRAIARATDWQSGEKPTGKSLEFFPNDVLASENGKHA